MRELTDEIISSFWAKEHITVATIDKQSERIRALVHRNGGLAISGFIEISSSEGFAQIIHIPRQRILFSARGSLRIIASIGHMLACLIPWETINDPESFLAESPYTRTVLEDMMDFLPIITPTRDDLVKIHKLARDYELAKQASAGTI